MKCSLVISNFLEEISSFSILLFSSISLHWSLRKAFLSLLAILWNSAFIWVQLSFSPLLFTSLLSQLFVRPLQTAILLFCISIFGDGLAPCLLYNVTILHPQFIRHSVYQIQSFKSISHFHCIIVRDLIQIIPKWSSSFSLLSSV